MLQARKTKTAQFIIIFVLLLVGIRSSAILGVGFVQAADSALADTYPLYLPLMSRDVPNIVFVSQRDGHDEIYSIAQDGSTLTRLTDSPAEKASPKWSPDGSKIAFISPPYGDADLYVMNQDGSGLRKLTDIQADTISGYSWSPDGTRIVVAAYSIFPPPGYSSWFIVDVNGEPPISLNVAEIDMMSALYFGGCIAWSPASDQIVFCAGPSNTSFDLYMMNPDGTDLIRLTNFDEQGYGPTDVDDIAWSSDGSKLVFELTYFPAPPEPVVQHSAIYIVNADGTGLTSLIKGSYDEVGIYDQPFLSPDGTRIAFVQSFYDSSANQTASDIYLMNADGTGVTKLIETLDFTSEPVWSPKGDQIVFSSNREIYLANMDGTGLINLSNHPGGDFAPDWQP